MLPSRAVVYMGLAGPGMKDVRFGRHRDWPFTRAQAFQILCSGWETGQRGLEIENDAFGMLVGRFIYTHAPERPHPFVVSSSTGILTVSTCSNWQLTTGLVNSGSRPLKLRVAPISARPIMVILVAHDLFTDTVLRAKPSVQICPSSLR